MPKAMNRDGSYNIIREQLIKIRKQQGMSLRTLAYKLKKEGHPISRSALSKIERNERSVNDAELCALSQALNVSCKELLERPVGRPEDLTYSRLQIF